VQLALVDADLAGNFNPLDSADPGILDCLFTETG
jgi:hypothetical protein